VNLTLMLNFGALVAFMGVNAAAFRRYFLRCKRTIGNCLPPLAGFAICLCIWLSLRTPAKLAGGVWLATVFARQNPVERSVAVRTRALPSVSPHYK
jgi:hypothetical protein